LDAQSGNRGGQEPGDLARAALDRFQTSQRMAQSFREQVDDQKLQVETLKGALVNSNKNSTKRSPSTICSLAPTGEHCPWQSGAARKPRWATIPRAPRLTAFKDRVHHTEAVATAEVDLLTDDVAEKLTRLDRDTEWTASSPI